MSSKDENQLLTSPQDLVSKKRFSSDNENTETEHDLSLKKAKVQGKELKKKIIFHYNVSKNIF